MKLLNLMNQITVFREMICKNNLIKLPTQNVQFDSSARSTLHL